MHKLTYLQDQLKALQVEAEKCNDLTEGKRINHKILDIQEQLNNLQQLNG